MLSLGLVAGAGQAGPKAPPLKALPAKAPAKAPSPVSEIVVEAGTGRVLHAREADRRRPPASIAKVMTLFLVFDALEAGRLDPGEPVRFSRRAAAQPASRLGVPAGRSVTVAQAIQALAVQSANDAAVALAEKVAGSEAAFASRMTARARSLGMTDTVFGNASGLPDKRTRTTARDIATLSLSVLKTHPRRYRAFASRGFEWGGRKFRTHNHILGRVRGADGIKTGYTAAAGYTLAASAVRNGRRLVAVVLGAPSVAARDRRVAALLEAGFARGS